MEEAPPTFDERTDASLVDRLRKRVLHSRRRRAAAVLVIVGTVVVAAVATGAIPGPTAERAPIDRVPAGADAVVVADASAAERPTTRTFAEGVATRLNASGRYAGPTRYRPLLTQVDDRTVAPLDAVDAVIGYGRFPANGSIRYAAVIVVAEWEPRTAVAAVEQGVNRSAFRNTSFVRDEIATGTVYRPTTDLPLRLGVLDGAYVVGFPTAVRDAVAVDRGKRPALSGPLRAAYRGTDDGAIRFAARVPNGTLAARANRAGLGELPSVGRVSGHTATANGTVRATIRLHATTADDAAELDDLVESGIVLGRTQTADPDVRAALGNLTVERRDARVAVTYEAPAGAASGHAVGVVDRAVVRRIDRLARGA